ncbi:MAG: YdbH domain-containing protein, partial [Thermodesulfobacteriota bacterium]|nr:YdbH domain-containing protein [Thermodesulfobacteriota bacterium]
MSLKRKLLGLGFSFLLVFLILFCTLTCLYFYIPTYMEFKLIPEIADKSGVRFYSCDVRRIGFYGTDLGSVRIGNDNNPALSIASVQIDYSPGELFKKKIKKVMLSGIELFCEYKNQEFRIRQLDLNTLFTKLQSSKKTVPSSTDSLQTLSIGRLEIRNAVVVFEYKGKTLRLPIELEIVPGKTDQNTWEGEVLECILRLYPGGQKIVFAANIHMKKEQVLLGFDTTSIHLGRFADFANLIPGLILSGEVDINGQASFQFRPFRISSASACCEFIDTEIVYNNFRLQTLKNTQKEKHPFKIEINGRGGKEWKISGTARNCKFRINGLDIGSNPPIFTVSGNLEHAKDFATYNVLAPDVTVNSTFGTIKIPSISLKGNAHLRNSMKKGREFATFELKARDTDLATVWANTKIPVVSLTGKLWKEKDQVLHVDSVFKFEDTGITDSKHNTKIDGICGIIPLKWPFTGTGKKGKYSVKRLWWRNRNLGSVTGTVHQTGSGLVFKAVHISSLLPDLSINFRGNAGMLSSNHYEAGIHFELKDYKTVSDIDLGQFVPSANGVTFNGEFGLNGDLTFDNTGIKGSLNAHLNNATLMLKEKGAAIHGIQTSLFLTDLFQMRSAPEQKLYFEKALFGELNIHDGAIEFQIESGRSFFLEKGGFGWCDGNVYIQAMRIYPKITDYNLVLYCDRLKLAMILEQFGAVNAEGQGTVSGRLPIKIHKDKICFTDGFLFSTPGEGGTIRLTGTEILTAGIPTNTPQYAQIELAREALKDYDYDWAKLNLMTEGENVLLRLQFD